MKLTRVNSKFPTFFCTWHVQEAAQPSCCVVSLDDEAFLDADGETVEGPAGLGRDRVQGPGQLYGLGQEQAHAVRGGGHLQGLGLKAKTSRWM